MKKTALLAVAVSMIALTAAACGNNGQSTNSTSATSTVATGSAVAQEEDFNPEDYVTSLGEYIGLEYTMASEEVTEEEIEDNVQSFLSGFPEKITDRAVESGDTANIDFEGKKDGVAFEGGTATGFDLTIGSNSFIAGFEDGLIGKKPGEVVELNLTFPENYREGSELNGADVVFTVTINYIKGDAPTELTDELVAANTEYKTAAEYRESIKKELTEQKKDQNKANAQDELFGQVVSSSSIKAVPQQVYDRYYTRFKNYYENMATIYGVELKDLLQIQLRMTEEDFEEAAKSYADNMSRRIVVMKMIAQKENLDVSDEEYKTALEIYYEKSGAKGQVDISVYEAETGKLHIKYMILSDKVVNLLMEKGKAVPAP